MKGSEKQIEWAEKIIADHKAKLTQIIESESKFLEGFTNPKLASAVENFKRLQELDWSNVDASKVIDFRDEITFTARGASAQLVKFWNVLAVVFGMSDKEINAKYPN